MARYIANVEIGNKAFLRGLKKLIKDQNRLAEAFQTLIDLKGVDIDAPPAKLHLHPLTNVQVPSRNDPEVSINPWTIHITRDDKFKASFTLEGNPLIAYMRTCKEHDEVDKAP